MRDFAETGAASVPTAKPRLSDYAGRNLMVHSFQTKRGTNPKGDSYNVVLVQIQVAQNKPPFAVTTYSEVILEQLRACTKEDFPFRAALVSDGKKLYFATPSPTPTQPVSQDVSSGK